MVDFKKLSDAHKNNLDFGFGGEEFTGEASNIPYAQFVNASASVFGLGITKANAELAGFNFKLDSGYQLIDHQFDDGTPETLYMTREPRLVVVNRSEPLMTKDKQTVPYNKEIYAEGDWKAFSYVVIWLLDKSNQPLSEMPFRLKCSGFAGITFLKNYSYYSNPDSFTKKFLLIYKQLTGDRTINKNNVFFAHAVYQITLGREKATSSYNNQSSMAVMTKSFLEPSKENFGSLIVRNGSPFSDRIKEAISETEAWLKTASYKDEENTNEKVETQSPLSPVPVTKLTNGINDNSEQANDILNTAFQLIGWTADGLNTYLQAKHSCTCVDLKNLPDQKLLEILEAIQDPHVVDMFVPKQYGDDEDIPF